ncbi:MULTISPECIES: helix-turn-helix domain-containing protein [unclassified Caballeronia]|uniref:helix-turn-helix domain-containing protein n=1 Tax=unclassified Caballeronia TaxID=2646786 RepID=UPI0020294E45|nr:MULTISPECIES: helix-turn-helix domain-containing protein [unclassified Caballeronia]
MAAIRKVTTDSSADPMCAVHWKYWLSEHVARAPDDVELPGICFIPEPSTQFKGSIEAADLGSLPVCRVSMSASQYWRKQSVLPDDAPLMVVIQTRGSSLFEQNGGGAVLCPGDWCVFDTARPFSVKTARESEHIVLMQRRQLAPADVLPASVASRRYGRAGVARLVHEMAVSAFRECEKLSARSAAATADSLGRLVGLAIEESAGEQRIASRLELITSYINEHLADPELDVRSLAHALDYSPRQIHRVFGEQSDITVTDYIWRTRLDRCVNALRSPDNAHLTITEIAYSWGFTSSAHFSRAFRAAFGVTPSAYRKNL